MKKIFLSSIYLFVYLFICLFTLAPSAFAVGSNVQPNKMVGCLHFVGSGVIGLPGHDPDRPYTETKQLTGTFPGNGEVYAIVCNGSTAGATCTTGNEADDIFLFGSGGRVGNVAFTSQKIKPDKNGVVNFTTVISGLTGYIGNVTQTAYTFRGVQISYPAPVGLAGNDGTQKQGTFNFIFKDKPGDCAVISWTGYDPVGVVFDAQSLEPIPGVTATIFDSTKKKMQDSDLTLLKNDQVTKDDGIYTYIVEPGIYYMEAAKAAYRFEDSPILHANAKKIYEFRDSIGTECTIYKKGEAIPELINLPSEIAQGAPNPECRNIPLTSTSGRPYIAPEVKGTYSVTPIGVEQAFEGKVTHPFTYIKILQNGKEIVGAKDSVGVKADQIADNVGVYDFKISSAYFNQLYPIDLVFVKANLTGNFITQTSPFLSVKNFLSSVFLRLFHLNVTAQTTSSKISVDLIPNFIEGYAYGDQNQIIQNAQVALRIKGAKADYYQTTADANGYFFIESGNLPPMEFTIEVTSPLTNKRASFRMYEFAKANESYFTKNNINLITGTRGGKTVTNTTSTLSPFDFGKSQSDTATAESQTGSKSQGSSSSQKSSFDTSGSSSQLPTTKKAEAPTSVNPLGPAIGIVLVLIFLIIVAGAIAAWAIMQKNRQQLPPMY